MGGWFWKLVSVGGRFWKLVSEVGFPGFLQGKQTSGPGRRLVSLAKTKGNQPPGTGNSFSF